MFDVIPEVCADVTIGDRRLGEVYVHPKRKKVAVVGFATNTLHLVPWLDPSFEIWGMNQGYLHCLRRCDRWFEMHLPEATADVRDPHYLDFLRQGRITWKKDGEPDRVQVLNPMIPIYMIQAYDEIPTSVRYPIEDAIAYLQHATRDYFMSTVAFMLSQAERENFEEIHLYGINLAIGDEYFYEKPNAEYWIGRLEGQGRRVYVPQQSSLLKQYRRYGYAIDARPAQSYKNLMSNRVAQYRSEAEQMSNQFHAKLGQLREAESLMQVAEGIDHGADIVLVPPVELPKTT